MESHAFISSYEGQKSRKQTNMTELLQFGFFPPIGIQNIISQ